MARRTKGIDLKQYTAEYIAERRQVLMDLAGSRNTDMDRFEKYYNLEPYEDSPGENDQRVVLPTPMDVVDKRTALLFSKRPTLSVPAQSSDIDDADTAQRLERVLYAMTDNMSMYRAMNQADLHANKLGEGGIKVWYKGECAEGEFPLARMVYEPRTVYGKLNDDNGLYTELVHTWMRARRDIESEIGTELDAGDVSGDKLDEWLDELVEYTEYWTLATGWSDEEKEREEKKEEPLSTVERAAELLMAPSMPPDTAAAPGESIGDYLADVDMEVDAPIKKKQRRKVHKVVHAIVVAGDEAQLVKRAVVMPGYKCIPYFSWGGTQGRRSLLYGILGPDTEQALGPYQASNRLMSLWLTESVRRAHAPLVTDDNKVDVDISPDAVNTIQTGKTLEYLQPPPTPPSLMQGYEAMDRAVQSVTLHEVLNGRVFNLSGQAISGLSSAFERQIALEQHEREVALTALYQHMLALVKEYADPLEGWHVEGNADHEYVAEDILPDDIPDRCRVQVKLSSSMPRDEMAWVQLFSNLQGRNQISMETWLDQLQKVTGQGWDTPNDEIRRILRDMWVTDSKFKQQISETLGAPYAKLLMGLTGGVPNSLVDEARAMGAPAAPPLPAGPPPGAPPGPQPTTPEPGLAGLPITPDMVAANGNLAGAMTMQGAMPAPEPMP